MTRGWAGTTLRRGAAGFVAFLLIAAPACGPPSAVAVSAPGDFERKAIHESLNSQTQVNVPPENVVAMFDAAYEFGSYPIS